MTTKNKWDYGGAIDRHPLHENMTAVIDNGSVLRVHNIFEPIPEHMKTADVIFCDPPCSKANINSFYTKADREDYQQSYEPFHNRFWEVIDELQPRKLFVEVFKSNRDKFLAEAEKRFKNVTMYQTTYYFSKRNTCWVIACSNDEPTDQYPFEGMDEERVIEWICEHEQFNTIGDVCMGQGLVGMYAYKHGKRFVGTELNKKRLAVLLERIVKLGGEYQIVEDEVNGSKK